MQSTTLSQITGRFRSSVTWKPEDWQKPLDAMVQRLCWASFVCQAQQAADQASKGPSSAGAGVTRIGSDNVAGGAGDGGGRVPIEAPEMIPIELTPDQWAILEAGEAMLIRYRRENNMPRYRETLQQYEAKAMEFFCRSRGRGLRQAGTGTVNRFMKIKGPTKSD